MSTPNLARPLHRLWVIFIGSFGLSAFAQVSTNDYAEDEVLIRFVENITSAERSKFELAERLHLIREIQTIRVRLYRLPGGESVESAVARYSKDARVDFAEANHARRQSNSSDPFYPQQWALQNIGQRVNGWVGPADIDINWPEAIAKFRGTAPVTVAVIDSGVALAHRELLAAAFTNQRELTGIPGVDDDGNGYLDDFSGWDFYAGDNLALDENGHGTLVASIIAGDRGNGLGGAGVCPTARIMSLRVLDQFGRGGLPKFARVSDVALALEYAMRNGARIANVSLGGSAFSNTELAVLRLLSANGVLVVAAAGNGGFDGIGDNNDIVPLYPASYNVDNIISVAAQDRSGGLAFFSNRGASTVHIAAPGTDIFGAEVTRRVLFFEDFQGSLAGWTVGSLFGNQSAFAWTNNFVGGNWFLADRNMATSSTYSRNTNTCLERHPALNPRVANLDVVIGGLDARSVWPFKTAMPNASLPVGL